MDKKLDFDFSGLTGKTEPLVQPPSPPKEAPKKKLTHITLSIPTENKETWLTRDLGECTSEEFIQWVEYVFPFHETEKNPERFESISVRKRAVREILQFHSTKLFSNKDEDELVH